MDAGRGPLKWSFDHLEIKINTKKYISTLQLIHFVRASPFSLTPFTCASLASKDSLNCSTHIQTLKMSLIAQASRQLSVNSRRYQLLNPTILKSGKSVNRITSFIWNPAKPACTQRRSIYSSRLPSTSFSSSATHCSPKQSIKAAMAPITHQRRSSTATPVAANLLPGFAFAFEYVF